MRNERKNAETSKKICICYLRAKENGARRQGAILYSEGLFATS